MLNELEAKYLEEIKGLESYLPVMQAIQQEVLFAENKYYWIGALRSLEEAERKRKHLIETLKNMDYIIPNEDEEQVKIYKLIDLAKVNLLEDKSADELYKAMLTIEILEDKALRMAESIDIDLYEKYNSFMALTKIKLIKEELAKVPEGAKVTEINTIYDKGAYLIEIEKEKSKKTLFFKPNKLELTIVRQHKTTTGKVNRKLVFNI